MEEKIKYESNESNVENEIDNKNESITSDSFSSDKEEENKEGNPSEKFTVEELHQHFSLIDSKQKEELILENLISDQNENNQKSSENEEEIPIKTKTQEEKKSNDNSFDPSEFVTLMKIGEGNFSEIFLVENKETKVLYALKQFVKRRVEQLKKQEEVLMEKYVMNKVSSHKYLIGFGGSYKDEVNIIFYQ